MTPPQAKAIKRLARRYPKPDLEERVRQVGRLKRIRGFYDMKVSKAPANQTVMFVEFMNSLTYAMTVITLYWELTSKLDKITQESDTIPPSSKDNKE